MSLVPVKFKFIEVSVLFFASELKRMQRKLFFFDPSSQMRNQ